MAVGDLCTKVDASAYGGIEFKIKSNAAAPSSLLLSLHTASNEVSAEWLNTYTSQSTPVSSLGRCVPSGFPPDQYDGTCVEPGVTIPVAQGSTFTTVSLRFEDFTGGVPRDTLEPSELTAINWSLPDGSYAVDIEIDDVRFVP